jgi:hypothetical protein
LSTGFWPTVASVQTTSPAPHVKLMRTAAFFSTAPMSGMRTVSRAPSAINPLGKLAGFLTWQINICPAPMAATILIGLPFVRLTSLPLTDPRTHQLQNLLLMDLPRTVPPAVLPKAAMLLVPCFPPRQLLHLLLVVLPEPSCGCIVPWLCDRGKLT